MAVSRSLRFQILRRDNHTCRYCGRTPPEVKLTVDHLVPEALGGTDDPTNLTAACEDCNGGKAATPPDAATVAQVNADALRWAAAQKAAAAQMLADVKARNSIYRKFDKKWREWANLDRPPNWKQSIDSFLAAGLPVEVLLDCVDRAMGNKNIRSREVFRYMCGIAWSRVTEIQNAAKKTLGVNPPVPSSDDTRDPLDPSRITWQWLEANWEKIPHAIRDRVEVPAIDAGRQELAEEILSQFTTEDAARYMQDGIRMAKDEGDEIPDSIDPQHDSYLLGRAATAAVSHLIDEVSANAYVVTKVLEALPADVRDECFRQAREAAEKHMPGEPCTDGDLQRWAGVQASYYLSGSPLWSGEKATVED